jgi:dipeptidyl-peptidase-4
VRNRSVSLVLLSLLPLLLSPGRTLAADPPRTKAEISDYQVTSTHAEVLAFCEALAQQAPLIRQGELGVSKEGRKLPLLILADPPISTPEEASRSGKLVVFAFANIHAGEVDGKEGLLMLARDLALAKDRPLLKDLILVFAPIFNADGNERFDKHRPSQAGPPLVGVRTNAQDLDLNRDFVKLESPEVRSLVRFIDRWDPAVVIDCHTTDGSFHRYTLTYEGGRCAAGDPKLVTFVRDQLFPDVGKRLEKQAGYLSFFYGNFSPDRSLWQTVPATPRYSTHYVGLRNRIGILSESYSYAPFKDRVLASRGFVQAICEYTAANKEAVRKVLTEARDATIKAGKEPKESDKISVRSKNVPVGRPVGFLGFVEEMQGNRRVPTDKPRTYELMYEGGSESTLSVARPWAYLVPKGLSNVVELMQRHGIAVEELREDIDLDVETYRVDKINRRAAFQKHQMVTVEATPRKESRRVEAGTLLVRTAQPLGSLAAELLEAQTEDGLVTWNFLDPVLAEGKDFPILRLPAPALVHTGTIRPLPEERGALKPITFDTLYGADRGLNFSGNPVSGLVWLEDGEHYLQTREGRLRKVEAVTGRSTPYYDPDKLIAGLASLPTLGRATAQRLVRGGGGPGGRGGAGGRRGGDSVGGLFMNPARTAALFEYESDLYLCNLDGTSAVRLTKSAGAKELLSFSPDGKFVSFITAGNLVVVDVATQTTRALTADAGANISNGKADWVYYEEVYNRDRRAYWWSPDSTRIAFLRFDDTPVRKYTIIDPLVNRQTPEVTSYPKAGDPNPLVKLGLVTVAGGEPKWLDTAGYSEASILLMRVGWFPDSQNAYCYVQDRAQTWLDFCSVSCDGGAPTRLFRETTKAWVDDPGPPTFLDDGSFLLTSERTGWKHLYHFSADCKLKGPVTSGEWEMRTLHVVDKVGGWVYFSGTRDCPIGSDLYRVHLDGSGLERLTHSQGDHRVSVSPKANLFIDTWSDSRTPTQVRLFRVDQSLARTLDTNPVHTMDEYRRGSYELVKIPTSDGFLIEASLLKPPSFDPNRKYPVWFMTYAGPHAPTIHDTWGGGRVHDEMLAQMGYLVFRADPRSASGKGACSTWTAYRQLGVQELKDIETAIAWLTKFPYVDAKRVGMSGHSYGGFMTAFALTHSKSFAAGIAGAPVTEWQNYDSVYTERYMNTPQENPDGYKNTSVVRAAGNLHGKLLLVHGLMDDNVHPLNSLALIDALERRDKDFELMVYPRNRHGIGGNHYQRLMLDFMARALHPEP